MMKQLDQVREKFDRLTKHEKKIDLISESLGAKFFKENEEARKSLYDVLFDYDKKAAINLAEKLNDKDIYDTLFNKPETNHPPKTINKTEPIKQSEEKDPLIRENGEKTEKFGKRLEINREYERALDLYLSENCIAQARYIVKFYLKERKSEIAKSLFSTIEKKPLNANFLAEVANCIGDENEVRKDIDKWVDEYITIRGKIKKLFAPIDNDEQIIISLMMAMKTLGGYEEKIIKLYNTWRDELLENPKAKIHDMIHFLYRDASKINPVKNR